MYRFPIRREDDANGIVSSTAFILAYTSPSLTNIRKAIYAIFSEFVLRRFEPKQLSENCCDEGNMAANTVIMLRTALSGYIIVATSIGFQTPTTTVRSTGSLRGRWVTLLSANKWYNVSHNYYSSTHITCLGSIREAFAMLSAFVLYSCADETL